MWPRTVEVMLACWLALSPFIFRHAPDQPLLWVVDFTAAAVVLVCSLLSFWTPANRTHLLNLAVGFSLVALAFARGDSPPPPAYQNYALVGLLLLMFGILPSQASRPPSAWLAFYNAGAPQGDPGGSTTGRPGRVNGPP